MTPEQRAAKVVADWTVEQARRGAAREMNCGIEATIAAAITAAVEQERERCAKIADRFVRRHKQISGEFMSMESAAKADVAEKLAAAIRKGEDT